MPTDEPGQAQKNKREFSLIVKLCALVLIVVVMAGVSYHAWEVASQGIKSIRLYSGHQTTKGVVTEDFIDASKTHYSVTINGQTYNDITDKKIRKGEVIEIAYLPNSPHINRPKTSLWNDTVSFGLYASTLLLILLYIFASYLKSRKSTHEE